MSVEGSQTLGVRVRVSERKGEDRVREEVCERTCIVLLPLVIRVCVCICVCMALWVCMRAIVG